MVCLIMVVSPCKYHERTFIIVILYFVMITHRHGGLMKSTKLSAHTTHDMDIGNACTAHSVAVLPG